MEEKFERISITTYNIRTDTPEDGMQNELFSWKNRLLYIKELFQEYQWDIVGLQEVRENQLNDLVAMGDYAFVGESRWSDDWGEYNPIFYKKEKFKLLSSKTFWLSKTPEQISKAEYWGAANPRICTIAHFELKDSGKKLVVANTHLDHIGEEARYQSSKLVMKNIKQYLNEFPVFLMGDFNGDENERWYKEVSKNLTNIMTQTSHHVGPFVTCTGVAFTYRPTWDEMVQIDYIFINEKVKINKTITITDQFKGIYPSDHYPVSLRCEI